MGGGVLLAPRWCAYGASASSRKDTTREVDDGQHDGNFFLHPYGQAVRRR